MYQDFAFTLESISNKLCAFLKGVFDILAGRVQEIHTFISEVLLLKEGLLSDERALFCQPLSRYV